MMTPSQIAVKAKAIEVKKTNYNFIDQVREDQEIPLLARYYTYNSLQTYNYRGYPSDTTGDNFD